MGDSWANPAGGLDLHLDVTTGRGVRKAITDALREAVRAGRLAPDTLLPSSRTLAADLGVARNTVAEAYSDLVAEGWLSARQGSGTRVARRAPVGRPATAPVAAPASAPSARSRYDLVPGSPDPSTFPRDQWVTSVRRALLAAPSDAFGRTEPAGRPELRRAVADYVSRARGVHTDPERVIVCSGCGHALRLLAGLLGRVVAVEEYGLHIHRDLLAATGARTMPVPVDSDGARIEALESTRARAVLLTPAHQFPTGGPLRPDRRTAVVDWARRHDGLVIEDDYDGEFRYDRQPVGAVQGLDPDRVVYLGSVSKSLSPALRLGWMVPPDRLIDDILAEKGSQEWFASGVEQLTLADFLDSGAYDRHVRRMRLRFRARRDRLVAALADRAPHVAVTGVAAGLHAVLDIPQGTEQARIADAAGFGLAVDGLATYRHPDAGAAHRDGLVVSYGTPAGNSFAGALEALCRTLSAP